MLMQDTSVIMPDGKVLHAPESLCAICIPLHDREIVPCQNGSMSPMPIVAKAAPAATDSETKANGAIDFLNYGHQEETCSSADSAFSFAHYFSKASAGDIDYENFRHGDHFAFRFELFKRLGSGSFGGVIKAFDHRDKKDVAVKLVRRDDGRGFWVWKEADIMVSLKQHRTLDSALQSTSELGLVELRDSLDYRGYTCLVMDLLGSNLQKILRANNNNGLHSTTIKMLVPSLLRGLAFLHECGFVHMDIKLLNIVVKNNSNWNDGAKLVDLNLACDLHELEVRRRVCESRQLCKPFVAPDFGRFAKAAEEFNALQWPLQPSYNAAPEGILCCAGLNEKMDVWALGTALGELALGHAMFALKSSCNAPKNCLVSIIDTFGNLPEIFIRKTHPQILSQYLCANGTLLHQRSFLSLRTSFGRGCNASREHGTRLAAMLNAAGCCDQLFVDFLSSMLCVDPNYRPSAAQLLQHPWLKPVCS